MAQIREILYRTIQADSGRKIGRSLGISRTSVRKYLDIASKQFGFTVNSVDQIPRTTSILRATSLKMLPNNSV